MVDTLDPNALAAAREKIDRIDDQMLQLLQDRACIVEEVARAKRAAGQETRSAFRPEREAMILRRLHAAVAAAGGGLAFAGVARVWREIMSAALVQQEPVTVSIPQLEPARSAHLRQLAREHFGGAVRFEDAGTMQQLFDQVRSQRNLIGLTDDLAEFAGLVGAVRVAPIVFARLPFCGVSEVAAFAFGHVDLAASGDDRTLVAVRLDACDGEAGVPGRLLEAGYSVQPITRDAAFGVFSIAGFHVGFEAERKIRDSLPGADRDWFMLGAYACPIPTSTAGG